MAGELRSNRDPVSDLFSYVYDLGQLPESPGRTVLLGHWPKKAISAEWRSRGKAGHALALHTAVLGFRADTIRRIAMARHLDQRREPAAFRLAAVDGGNRRGSHRRRGFWPPDEFVRPA